MQAVYFNAHGGPEVLEYSACADPVPSGQQVLIGVEACALNHLDIWQRQGLLGVSMPMPHISGSDVAGVVLERGPQAGRFKKGDRVLVSPGQLPLTALQEFDGRDSYSPQFQILGLQSQGGYAEKICVDEHWALPVSDKYSLQEWASFPLTSLTAYHMLVTRAQIRPGESVLIHAAGSGVGVHAIQLAKALGAVVYATVGDESKASRAEKIGADRVILYRTENFAEKINQFTSGRGVDIILDSIGQSTWTQNLESLCRGGRMVTCGVTAGPKAEVAIRSIFSKQLSILGAYMGSFAELTQVLSLIEAGKIKPVIDQVFELKDAAEAQRRMENRLNFGKILLRVG